MENTDKTQELLEMCYYGHIDQVKPLLEQGIDVNGIGYNGISPLDAARDGENNDIVEYLLSIGAKQKSNPAIEIDEII